MTLHPDILKVLEKVRSYHRSDMLPELSLEELGDLNIEIEEANGFVDEQDINADYDATERLQDAAFLVANRGDVWGALRTITDKLNEIETKLNVLVNTCDVCGRPTTKEQFCSDRCAAKAEIDT